MPMPKKTSPSHRKFDSREQQAYLNLWRAYDRLRAEEDALFGRFDLTAQQYNALRILRARHPRPVPTLALQGRLVSRAPDITRMLDRLEQRGLVARSRPAENRRVVEVTMTAAGHALLAELDEPVRACHDRQLGHMKRDQLDQLIALLEAARAPHEDADSPWRVES